MKRTLLVGISIMLLSTTANGASVVGLTFGLPSVVGQKSERAFDSGSSYTLNLSIIGTGNYSFETGLSQLIDIKDDYSDTETLETSLTGLYFAGRYSTQFSQSGFAYTRLGVYRWSAKAVELNTTKDDSSREIASTTFTGFSPTLAIGADYLLDEDDFIFRTEVEYIYGIGGGGRLESDNRVRNVTEPFNYTRINLGFLLVL